MKKNIFKITSLFLLIVSLSACNESKTTMSDPAFEGYNFIVANDLGRNGYYDQKTIAENMGALAENTDI